MVTLLLDDADTLVPQAEGTSLAYAVDIADIVVQQVEGITRMAAALRTHHADLHTDLHAGFRTALHADLHMGRRDDRTVDHTAADRQVGMPTVHRTVEAIVLDTVELIVLGMVAQEAIHDSMGLVRVMAVLVILLADMPTALHTAA